MTVGHFLRGAPPRPNPARPPAPFSVVPLSWEDVARGYAADWSIARRPADAGPPAGWEDVEAGFGDRADARGALLAAPPGVRPLDVLRLTHARLREHWFVRDDGVTAHLPPVPTEGSHVPWTDDWVGAWYGERRGDVLLAWAATEGLPARALDLVSADLIARRLASDVTGTPPLPPRDLSAVALARSVTEMLRAGVDDKVLSLVTRGAAQAADEAGVGLLGRNLGRAAGFLAPEGPRARASSAAWQLVLLAGDLARRAGGDAEAQDAAREAEGAAQAAIVRAAVPLAELLLAATALRPEEE